jgi:hypothetical protein
MFIDTITKSLEVYLGGAATANQLPVYASYIDHTATAATPGASDTQTNGVTAVTVVAAPAGSTQRQVKTLTVYNADTVAATVFLRLNNNSTMRIIRRATLNPGETWAYTQETGFQVLDIMGALKLGGSIVRMAPLLGYTTKDAANLTAVTAMATTVCHCYYIGVAPFSTSSINLLVNVTALVATITWAEVAIYKGTPMLNAACPDLTRLGYTDVAGTFNTTGRKNVIINLTVPANPGDNLWVVLGSAATTPFQIRGALADDLQCGIFNTLTARPSLTAGPTAGTLAGATVVPGWVTVKLN